MFSKKGVGYVVNILEQLDVWKTSLPQPESEH